MKCPGCKRNMVRRKKKEHYYYYECTYCRTIVGNNKDKQSKEDNREDKEDKE